MSDKHLNDLDDFIATLTPEEVEALKEADEGFDFGDDDTFDPAEVQLAKETMEARAAREAAGETFDHNEDAAKAEEEAAEGAKPEEAAEPKQEPEVDTPAPAPEQEQEPEAKADPAPAALPDAEIYRQAMEAVDADIDTKIAEITDKYDDAEITSAEMKAQIKALNDSRRDAITATVERINFDGALRAFFAENPELNSDDHVPGFDAAFSAVDSNPLFKGVSDIDKLREAHRIYADQAERARAAGRTTLVVPQPKGAREQAPAPKAEAAPPKADPKLQVQPRPENHAPKTLARMPASDASHQGDSKSEKIMSLLNSKDPDAIEKALRSNAITLADLEEMG